MPRLCGYYEGAVDPIISDFYTVTETDCIFVVLAIDRLMDAQTTTRVLTLPETDMA